LATALVGGDRRVQRGRHIDLRSLCGRDVCATLPAQDTTLGQFAHYLLGEERITGGPLGDLVAQCTNRGVWAEQLGNQCRGLCIAQRRKGYRLRTRHLGQCAVIFRTVGEQHQRGRLRDHHEELRQHRLADLIDPVHVLNDIDRRGFAGQRRGIDQRGQPPPTGIGIDYGQGNLGIGDAQ
jgi:hypothetical protein